MKRMVTSMVFAVPLTLLSGCAFLNSLGQPTPVKENKLGSEMRTLSLTADRRVILVRTDKIDKENGEVLRKGGFCAEPPPDAAQNISSALRAIGDLSTKEEAAKAKGEIAASLATSIQRLVNRSQGLQFYRDGMYFLCQSSINETLSPEEFKQASGYLLDKSVDLIKLEITETHGIINAIPQVPLPTSQDIRTGDHAPTGTPGGPGR